MATPTSSSIIACLKSFNQFIEDIKHLQQARDVLADDEESNDEESADDALCGKDRKPEIQELQESLATNINCLFQMSILVRKPAQHDVYLGSDCADVAAFELSGYSHVRDKYPKADDVLVKRLGNAITRRHKYLKYRERNAAKLRQSMSNVDPGLRDLQRVREGETITLGTTSDIIIRDFEQLNTGFDDEASDKGISQTSHAEASHAPTLLSEGHVAVPRPPNISLGGVPFECPYCFYVITVDGSRSWNKHVFQDLQPYVCVSPTCTTPDKLYSTRHEWLYHSKMAHPAAMKDDDTPNESTRFAACPLCKENIDPGRQFDRHLAHHLQELALFSLLGGGEDSDVGEDQNAESSSDAESAHLAASHDEWESSKGLRASPVEYPATIEFIDSSYGQQEHDNNEDKKEERRQSIILLEKEVNDRQRLLGPEHQDTLTSMVELTNLCYTDKRYEEAVNWGKQVMKTKKRLLGEKHLETLQSMTQLTKIYQAQQRWIDAGGPQK